MKIFKIVVLILLISGCREKPIPLSLKTDIDSISHKWVPDTREGICNVKLEKQGKGLIVIKGETDIPGAKQEIVDYFTGTGLNYRDSITLLPDPTVITKSWGLISVSVSNLKKDPSFSSELVSQTVMGNPVKILKKRGSWMLVQTSDYYLGWVTGSSISELDDEGFGNWKKSERIIYLSKTGDILSADPGKEVVSDIVAGVILRVKSKTSQSYNVVLPDGREGNILSKDAMDFNSWCRTVNPDPAGMIAFGKSMNGSPYLWGGTSTKGVDCSGFTKTLYFSGGIILARDASLQFRYGKPAEVTDSFEFLLPGDLIFFGRLTDKGVKRITHVGMYIGDTEVIHSSGMVRINSLDPSRTNYSSYLKESVMGARRIIGTPDGRGIQSVKNHPWYTEIN